MRSIVIIFICVFFQVTCLAQSFNGDKVAFTNYLVRMYKAAPFDGIRVVEDYDDLHLVSVVLMLKEKYNSVSDMNRVAAVKASSQVARYLNGSTINDELIIRTTEDVSGETVTEITELIRENSYGYSKALEQLTNFEDSSGNQVFIFSTKMGKN